MKGKNMAEARRDNYLFVGKKAEDSAKWYDLRLSHGYSRSLDQLAWESAHKYGSNVIKGDKVSFRYGIIYGEKAREAVEYFDKEFERIFNTMPKENRRSKMIDQTYSILIRTEVKFNVKIEILDDIIEL